MIEPSFLFRGNALILNGEVLPFFFSSPYLVIECLRGNAPPTYFRVGWATPIVNSDIGQQEAGKPVNLLFGKRYYSFNIFPFNPKLQAYQLRISLRYWITQLDANFYEVTNWEDILKEQNTQIFPTNPNNSHGVGGGNIPPGLI